MIKFLFKSIIVVALLLLLIPLFKLLLKLINNVCVGLGAYMGTDVDPRGVGALFLIGLALLLIALAIKD